MSLTPHDDARALARRLRQLRTAHFGRVVPQSRLGEALRCSVPLISAWESLRGVSVPTEDRLRSYAAFFSTARSIANGVSRLLAPSELTPDEAAERARLERELLDLRAATPPAPTRSTFDPWRFRAGEPIRIVCARLPAEYLQRMPYVDPRDPDFVSLYRCADLDSLLELHGYLRAVNPDSPIEVRAAPAMTARDYEAHLALLGGVDWNVATRYMLEQLRRNGAARTMPVRQQSFLDRPDAGFVAGGDRFRPVVVAAADFPRRGRLVEDVAHFFRGPNPLAAHRTVTICNGMYGRGVFGAVLALTRRGYRERNAGFIRSRFAGSPAYSVLSRVRVVRGDVVVPDWTVDRLHEWPPASEE